MTRAANPTRAMLSRDGFVSAFPEVMLYSLSSSRVCRAQSDRDGREWGAASAPAPAAPGNRHYACDVIFAPVAETSHQVPPKCTMPSPRMQVRRSRLTKVKPANRGCARDVRQERIRVVQGKAMHACAGSTGTHTLEGVAAERLVPANDAASCFGDDRGFSPRRGLDVDEECSHRSKASLTARRPAVRSAERLFGDPDYLLRVVTADLAAYQVLRDEQLATLPGVHRLSYTDVTNGIVEERPLPLHT